ncbi:MAG: hypothetical protein IKO68_09710 [Oscillospiraceae bacterium]|nr:hypothetical protein [Oscillospiraceae bacterium]
MSENAFISFLQQLLTMLDKNDPSSVDLARNALSSVVSLASASGKADGVTLRTMRAAKSAFNYLVEHAEDFAGTPGHYGENEKKRTRLRNMLYPGC